jgi:hypothetical protein
MSSWYPLHMDTPAEGGGGQQQRQQEPPESRATKQNSVVDQFIRRHGTAEGALAALAATNVTLDDENRELRTQVTALRGKIPDPDKQVVLPKDRVDTFNAFEALKLKPEDVTKLQTENKELKDKVHVSNVRELAREGAPRVGYDPDAVADLVVRKALHAELREVEVERKDKAGKAERVKVKVPYVRPAADDRAQLQPLTDYAKTLPVYEQRGLAAQPPANGQQQQAQPQEGAANYPEQGRTQGGGEGEPGKQAVALHMQRYQTPGQLREKRETKEPVNAA